MILTLIEAALRALLVAVTVWMGLRVLRVRNVPAQKVAWGLVLACAVAMPFVMRWQWLPKGLTLRLPATLLHAAPATLPASEPVLPRSLAAVNPAPRREFAAEPLTGGSRYPAPLITAGHLAEASQIQDASMLDAPSLMQGKEATAQTSTADASRWAAMRKPSFATLAALLYAAVCVALLARMVFGLVFALKLWRAAEPFIPLPATGSAPDPTVGLRVRFSRGVASPVTIGSGVLLPEECLAWDDEKLRIVLAHERAHVLQGDFYLQLAAGLYAAAFWFSPLGWWLKRILCDLGEAISDRAGLEQAASHTSYAQVLLEFAALPRPTSIGVAMARSNNLSQRIERLLNESSFRQAFAGSRRRILIALMLVPVALFAGTALVRVEAQATQAVPAPPVSPAPAAEPLPASEPAPAQAPATAAEHAPAPAPDVAPPPPVPPVTVVAGTGEVHDSADDARADAALDAAKSASGYNTVSVSDSTVEAAHAYAQSAKAYGSGRSRGYSYSYSSHGDSYALVTEPGKHISFSGEWNDETRSTIDDARKLAHGNFLWFTHDGKSYLVDDQAVISQLEAMYKPIEALGKQQEALGKQQEELGRKQEELGRKQEQASIPTPDMSKELAELNAAVARMNAKKGSTISQDQLAELEGKIGDLQGKLGSLEGEIGEKQGKFGEAQGKLGDEQGKLGEQQGALGEQQGKLAEQADRKIKSVIDQSLKDGKARPIQ